MLFRSIANLLLYSELLMEETLPASAKANVEALYKQSEKLRFLIDSLVKLSRLENGIISLSPQQSVLQPLLESVVEQYTAKASEKGLSLQMQDTASKKYLPIPQKEIDAAKGTLVQNNY